MSQFFLFKQWFKGPLLSVEVPASLIAQLVKNQPSMQEIWVPSLGWEDPLEKETATHWPGEFHGQRSLAGYSPTVLQTMGLQESDMTWLLRHTI